MGVIARGIRTTDAASVVRLADVTRRDVSLVGGKAANLGELVRAGFAVPDGFVLTADAFASFHQAGGASDGTATLASAAIPAELRQPLRAAVARLGDAPLAVRSSAIEEDGPAASFAGQYETYLNVRGPDAVADAVLRCSRAANAARLRDYRRGRDLPGATPRLAILVQRLIVADVSAVAYGAHPVTGRRDEIVVEATWGMGESLVGGTVTPDAYHLRKVDGAITLRRVATKTRMTVVAPDGTREVDVPRSLQARPALDDRQILAAARLALALEQIMGWPVDLECAFAGDHLHLLQCRPITALGS